jgi:hypothetical protein
MRRHLPALAGLALAGLALAGCATGGVNYPAGGPGGNELDVDAAWLAGGSMIVVVTYGSSSCAPLLDGAVLDGGALVVSLKENPDSAKACTDDLAPQPLLVGTPAGVDPAKELEIQVTLGDSLGDTDLDGYTGGAVEEYTPSAAWVDDGLLAILTWGSSSCAPVVQSATAETPDTVAVSFVTPAADQVCTMDMAPRVVVTSVEGEVSDDATLSLGPLGASPDGAGGGAIPIH